MKNTVRSHGLRLSEMRKAILYFRGWGFTRLLDAFRAETDIAQMD